jgi:hypothetical protein
VQTRFAHPRLAGELSQLRCCVHQAGQLHEGRNLRHHEEVRRDLVEARIALAPQHGESTARTSRGHLGTLALEFGTR